MVVPERKSPEYTIHKKIYDLCKSRNIVLDNYEVLSLAEFNNVLNSVGLLEYNGRQGDLKYKIAMIATTSNYIKKAPLNKYINSSSADKYIIILTTNKKISIDNEEKDVEFLNGNECMLRNYPKYFETKGIRIRVLSKEEVKNIQELLFISNTNKLPKIKSTCHECIYSGAEPGDILEIITLSITTSLETSTIVKVVN